VLFFDRLTKGSWNLNGVARVEIHSDMDHRRLRALDNVTKTNEAVIKCYCATAEFYHVNHNLNLIAINDGLEELSLDVHCGKAKPTLSEHQVVWNSAMLREESFHCDMAIVKQIRIVNKAGRVCISEGDGDSS
jgi:hypothetical protein